MKNIIKKIGVFVFALALMVSTASTVLAHWAPGDGDGEGSKTPAPWAQPGPEN